MSTKILFAGDLHGDLERAKELIQIACDNGCIEIVQAGDWGFIWPEDDKYKELSTVLTANKMSMRFVDGNHDVHPTLRKFEKDKDNNVAPGITYQFRGSKKVVGGVVIVFLGGAPSIDRESRIGGVSWWPEEYITDEETSRALIHSSSKVDVLVTHDAPVMPTGFKDNGNMSFYYHSQRSQAAISRVINKLNPDIHVHGHYHHRYSSKYEKTRIEGLASNLQSIKNNYIILDLPTPSKTTKPEGPVEHGSKKRETQES